MHQMRKAWIYGLFLASVGTQALASDTFRVTWEQPMLYELQKGEKESRPMNSSEIANYEIHYTIDEPFKAGENVVYVGLSGVLGHVIDLDLKPRREPYKVNAAVRTHTIMGAKSDFSNVVSKVFNAPLLTPQPPTNISLEIRCTTCATVKP